jgi:hypothetical protein
LAGDGSEPENAAIGIGSYGMHGKTATVSARSTVARRTTRPSGYGLRHAAVRRRQDGIDNARPFRTNGAAGVNTAFRLALDQESAAPLCRACRCGGLCRSPFGLGSRTVEIGACERVKADLRRRWHARARRHQSPRHAGHACRRNTRAPGLAGCSPHWPHSGPERLASSLSDSKAAWAFFSAASGSCAAEMPAAFALPLSWHLTRAATYGATSPSQIALLSADGPIVSITLAVVLMVFPTSCRGFPSGSPRATRISPCIV